MEGTKTKKWLFIAAGIVILIIGYFLPCPEGLSQPGKMSIAILLFTFALWFGDVMPKSVAAILAIILLPFFGILETHALVYSSFINSIFFFLLAIFGLSCMFSKTDLPVRLMATFLKIFGNNTKMIVFGFGATAFVISCFMTDLAATALIAGIFISLSKELSLPKDLVKCTMMIIPLGGLAGGCTMPIGSAVNITIMQMLANQFGQTMSFAQWMCVGIPVGLIIYIVGWLLMMAVNRPAPLDEETMTMLKDSFKDLPPMDAFAKKTLILLICMIVCWIAGSWIKVLDSTLVALFGWIIMFLPGVDLLTWDEYQRDCPFDLIFMLSATFSLCAGMQASGAIDWIVGLIMGDSASWSPLTFYLVIAVAFVLIRAFLPNGAPIVVMLTPGVLALAATLGIDQVWVICTLGALCSWTSLLPLIDAVWLMTFRTGEYTIADVLKWGIILSVIVVLVVSFISPALVSVSYVFAA